MWSPKNPVPTPCTGYGTLNNALNQAAHASFSSPSDGACTVGSYSVPESCLTLCDPPCCSTQASLSFTICQRRFRLMSTESVMPSSRPILCGPLLLIPSVFPSTRVFFIESALRIRWPKYWSFSLSIGPSNEYSGLISFRVNWLSLQSKSLLQHHSSKASILRHPAFLMVQLKSVHDSGKTI